jgi:N-methylhydantoinase A
MNPTQPTYRLGVDIGGTFTDIVLLGSDGTVRRQKVLSTPGDYVQAILAGLEPLLPCPVAEVVHGTTVATNTILEGKGALTGLITTAGFRDVLEIGRLRYPRLYDLSWEKPPPLAPRRLRQEVRERIGAKGEIIQPLDVEEARAVIQRLLAQKIEALAVCLINAYVNPSHEQHLGQLVRELAPGLPVSLSGEVLPEIKEYERTSTTVINATLQPIVSRYLRSLSATLAETFHDPHLPLYVMQSNGGVMSAAAAAERPIHIIESGPAAGVIAALAFSGQAGLNNLLTLDMGGTTAKAALIESGQVMRSPEYQLGGGVSSGARLSRGGGYPLRVPAIDIAEVGAGGGSLVRVDRGGALRVGPESAGAVPGPACYALGGELPTLTDANVVLGYLNPDQLAGGAVPLQAGKARQALHDHLALPLRLSLPEVAYGIHQIAVANMARVARAVSVERGRDPREFVLAAFGGNGPLHAAGLARLLGMRRILIPPSPGLFSAFGLLFADLAYHLLQTYRCPLAELGGPALTAAFEQLKTAARAELTGARPQDQAIIWQYALDLRYSGQSYELTLPFDLDGDAAASPKGEDFRQTLGRRFAAAHERLYGHAAPGDPVEVVNVRLTALKPNVQPSLVKQAPDGLGAPTAASSRRCYFGPEIGWLEVPVLPRVALGAEPQPGPLIIEEYDSTLLVPPDGLARRDQWDNILIEIEVGEAYGRSL